MRVKRGTIRSEREGGRLYVFLTPDPTSDPTDRTELLIAEVQDRIRSLEEANRENRRIIAGLTQRIPALEAPQGDEKAPQTASEGSEGGGGSPLASREPQDAAQRRPWWRRVFRG